MEEDLRITTAAESGNLELVKTFASQGANVDAGDKFGATALMKACFQEQTELVRLLLELGADVNIRDRAYGSTALILASLTGRAEILAMLLAASAGYREMIGLLLERGADINFRNCSGYTALLAAHAAKRTDVIRLLMIRHLRQGRWTESLVRGPGQAGHRNRLPRMSLAC